MIRRSIFALAGLAALAACASAQPSADARQWVGVWASSQQVVEPQNIIPPEDLRGATLRQIVRVSRGGETIRLRLSNRFGTEPLQLKAVSLARSLGPGAARIDASTDRALTFSGQTSVNIPAGADYLSDPVDFPLPAFADIAVSIEYDTPPSVQTGHPGSRTTSFVLKGQHASAADLPAATPVTHWYQIASIEVLAQADAAAIVIIGDSITDGRGSTTDGNDRWPDFLMRRLQENPQTRHLSVLNMGVGGNRLLHDRVGPNALARFDNDVIVQSGATFVIVFEGVNDIGTLSRTGEASQAEYNALARRMIAAYEQMITRAHARGLKIFGATILAYGGSETYRATPASESARQAVNEWIRTSGRFDAVIDLDAATRDANDPMRLLPAYDSGDHLHPSPQGFRAMAEAVPVSLFAAP